MSGVARSIAVIGLGAMGLPMALRLVAAGFDVRGVDRSEAARGRFAAAGGRAVAGAAEAVSEVDAVLLLVVNADQAEDVLFGPGGVAARLRRGAVVILSITASPERSRMLGRRLAERDLLMIDCPVSGGIGRAAKGTLSLLASGPAAAIAAAEPLLAAMGKIYRLGEEHGQASAVKLLNQLLCGVHIAAAAETVALAERLGLDPRSVVEVILASSGTSWMFADRAPAMIEEDGRATAAVAILQKDLALVAELAQGAGARTPLGEAALALFREAEQAGMGKLNDSRIIERYRR